MMHYLLQLYSAIQKVGRTMLPTQEIHIVSQHCMYRFHLTPTHIKLGIQMATYSTFRRSIYLSVQMDSCLF